jgi:hypothetical protein
LLQSKDVRERYNLLKTRLNKPTEEWYYEWT